MAKRAFGNKAFRPSVKPPRVQGASAYHAPKVLSAHQFKSQGRTQFRNITKLGSTRIVSSSKSGTRFSQQGGAGYRIGTSGRITHRQNFS